jgi:hypothetical protein
MAKSFLTKRVMHSRQQMLENNYSNRYIVSVEQ